MIIGLNGVQFGLFITGMITDRIGQHEVLLPINHKNYNFREKKNTKVWKRKICIKSFYTVSMLIDTKNGLI